ncbi:MAG: NADP-dependent malic enzyme [Proteobacteria bacterium]|nr:NADP-dependent malic enzyme [Pseudomonadota bacterium]
MTTDANDHAHKQKLLYEEALRFHAQEPKGKVGLDLIKPLANQRDLSLAYSPGVAAACLEIEKDPHMIDEYTSRGNWVAVVSNGTAILGLGDLGPKAFKPVGEGKAALFKRFAGIDSIDIEIDTKDIEEFVTSVRAFGATFGGINLEDIKAPDCFVIEERLKGLLDVPVFHDDQHGTAIITAAGMINALDITGRNIKDLKVVVSGAGAAAIACIELLKKMGVPHENITLCDTQGVIYKGRTGGMNPWKEKHAVETKCHTLAEALVDADAFLGLSIKGAVTQEMVKKMAKQPIIFAMANPDPEITPEAVKEVRPDAIVATGRSDYPNQVNNVMGFPYVFRGALDVRASAINDDMKIAAAKALAMLAREDVPNEVIVAYSGRILSYGPDYIIPVPFDPRLIEVVPMAVANAAIETGVARKNITDMEAYRTRLASLLNPAYNITSVLFERLKHKPRRVIFAEGDEDQIIRAAVQWKNQNYGTPILVAYNDTLKVKMREMGMKEQLSGIEVTNAALHPSTDKFIDQLYLKLQRKGYLYRDCARMVKRNRNIFAAMMLENGEADAMLTGLTRSYFASVEDVMKVIDPEPGKDVFGLSIVTTRDRTLFIADTTINELPNPEEMVRIAIQVAAEAKAMGHEPRVAFLSFSNFGNPMREKAERMRQAVALMDTMEVDFEYDGEMEAHIALNPEALKMYPFCRLSKPANILIMPGLHSANIVSNLLQELGGYTMIGPVLCGMKKQVQVLQMSAKDSDVMNVAALAANRASVERLAEGEC